MSISPPPSSIIQWTISPSGPFEPNHAGEGDFANLILNDGTFGDTVTIRFDISTLCGDTTISKTFFAGKPKIFDQRINGIPGTLAYLCPGTHWVSAKALGANSNCFVWEVFGDNPFFASCNTVDVFMPGYSGATAINANVENVCGTNDSWFFLMRRNFGCEWHWILNVFPNPASDILNVQVTVEDESEVPKMEWIQLINDKGVIVRTVTDETDQAQINVAGLQGGIYTVTASVGGVPISRQVQIIQE